MSQVFDAAVDVAATYRLTKLVIDDRLVEAPREWLFERFPPESTYIGYLVTCPWCVSMWVGLGTQVARAVAPRLWGGIALALAASAVSGIVYERT